MKNEKCYKVKVRETHYYERYVYVNAESKTEANKKARKSDWIDANAGEWNWANKDNQIIERAVLHYDEPL